MFKGN